MGGFRCRRCGNCCRWPGAVRVSEAECRAIAAHLGLATDDFIERFTRITPDRQALSLTETEAGACIFLEEAPPTCRIEAVKPRQCRDFPEHWNFPGWEQACEGGREKER